MEQNFYIVCILSFLVVLVFTLYLLLYICKEISLYRVFSKNDELRTLMAKDPMRFHISIIYLMTYMTRSNGDAVQLDKLELIVQYIREICPTEYQSDAIKALKYLTDRESWSGKNKKKQSLVDIKAFETGSAHCLKEGDDSYHYIHELHGTKLAEELGRYLSEDECFYVMYLLYRLAIADNKITTKGKKSEYYMLHNLCVKGLKIDKSELEKLLNCFVENTEQQWYDSHFQNKGNRYPSSDKLANIFHCESGQKLNFLDRRVPKTSVQVTIHNVLEVITIIEIVLCFMFFSCKKKLMGDVYSSWFIFIGIVATILMSYINTFGITKLESSILPVLRTKVENSLQLKGLILSSVLSLIGLLGLHFGVSNVLFLMGNEVFCNEDSFGITVPVTETHHYRSSSGHGSTYYYVRFNGISFLDADFESCHKKQVSEPNKLCLEALKMWSGMNLKGVKNTKKIRELEVDYDTYEVAEGKNIQLLFKVGYFGLLYFDSYSLQ